VVDEDPNNVSEIGEKATAAVEADAKKSPIKKSATIGKIK
jgi:hypothetical protein